MESNYLNHTVMKKIRINKQVWQSMLSVIVFGVFVYLALGSFKPEQVKIQKELLDDGNWISTVNHKDGSQEVTKGGVDENNNWNGEIIIEYLDADGNKSFEKVNMDHGYRHGESEITDSDGNVKKVCYDHGERVECKKSATITDNSAFEILSYKYPWYAFKLNALGFKNDYFKAFLDTFETVLNTFEFDLKEFDSYYGDVNDIFEETQYDSIVLFNSVATYLYGIELSKSVDFRLAIIDKYRSSETSVFNVVKTKYPNYLITLNEYEVTENDFKDFCVVFDSIMYSYGFLDKNNPFFVDSIDERMFRAISFIASEENSLVAEQALKSLNLNNWKIDLNNIWKQPYSTVNKTLPGSNPTEVSLVVISIILMKYIEGDLIRSSLLEAYSLKKGIAIPPTVTTSYISRNSSSSVTLAGNVTSDGGAEITSRGIVWGTGYNPLVTNNSILLGKGTGSFETSISGLNESETYYARSFATNSAGTEYGNCIKFTTKLTVGVETLDLSEMHFKVFPNPVSGAVNFSFQLVLPENLVFSIINQNGQIVIEKQLRNLIQGENHIELNLSDFENGIYFGRLTNSGLVISNCKFLVSH